MKREFGIEFPADFREIVNAYGSIQINGQLSLEHPAGHLLHTLAEIVRGDLEVWRGKDMAGFLPGPAGANPGESVPVVSATTEDVTVCSRDRAPDRPFYEPLS
ncbi:hypothetical protein ACH4MA_03420 [Streptomyces roseolus]|uniref:hypothetical protein n=1 Tax=Streptomyces roseolus TaxID=67358 RepID=UPI003792170D